MSLLSRTTNFISNIATFIYNSVVGLVTCILSIPSLILYYSPILLPSAFFIATFFIPQLYLPFLATMGILTTLAIYSDLSLFKATPKRDVLSDFTKRFQELVSYLTIYRRNDWLKKEGTNNLTEYYHKLRNANDLTSEALSLSYDEWFDAYHQGKEKNWKMC